MVATRNTRADVIAAAGRLFADRGYHGTSMRDLGKELGLQGSSLYSHVESKEDLLVAVVKGGAELFEASATAAIEANETAADRMRALIAGHVDIVLDHANEAKTFLDEARSLEDSHRERIISARNTYEQVFRDVISQGSEDGSFDGDLDPALSAIFILSVLNAVERWYNPSQRLDRAALVDEIVAHVSRSLT